MKISEEIPYMNIIKLTTIEAIKVIPNTNIKITKINIGRINKTINNIKESILNEINKLLHNIGMRDNLSGYYCYLDGILYNLIKDNQIGNKYMYHIYETGKKKYKKNIQAIEREMRYAKESSWKYNSHVYIEKVLGYSFNYKNNIPTNMELIIALTECIRKTIGY